MVIVSRPLMVRDSVNYVGWIESTGTQYVDLELSMPKGFHVVCDIEFTSLSGFNAVIGAHDQSSPYNRNYLATNGTGWEFGFLGLGSFGSVTTNTRYEIDACNISGSIFCKINGVSQSFDTSGATGSARSELSLYALAMNYSANLCCARAKLRGMKVYADAGYTNLLRDLRPCYDSDGVACFYDKAEKKYYYNAGTGEFGTPEAEPEAGVAVGTTWVFTSNGSFEVPANGNYQLELHGGGGGGASAQVMTVTTDGYYHIYQRGGAGGGSGEVYQASYTKGTVLPITIGAGGAGGPQLAGSIGDGSEGSKGGTTTCGAFSLAGGGGGQYYYLKGGAASGSLATAGTDSMGSCTSNASPLAGGQGNKNNTAQTYGDGGASGGFSYGSSRSGSAGQPGAVIITYLGVS